MVRFYASLRWENKVKEQRSSVRVCTGADCAGVGVDAAGLGEGGDLSGIDAQGREEAGALVHGAEAVLLVRHRLLQRAAARVWRRRRPVQVQRARRQLLHAAGRRLSLRHGGRLSHHDHRHDHQIDRNHVPGQTHDPLALLAVPGS